MSNTPSVPTETLCRLYLVERLTLKQIGARVYLHPTIVGERLRAAGVPMRRRGTYERPQRRQEVACE